MGQAERVQASEDPGSQGVNVDLLPMPQALPVSGRVAEGRPISSGYLARDRHSGEENHCDHYHGEHGADQGCNGHANIKEAIEQDASVWEDGNDRDCACSPMEQRALRASATEAQKRRGPAPPTRRVQLRSYRAPSDPNDLYSTQLERFLSLLVQADSRLVGSRVGHRVQLVDCRMTAEGQELDSLTEAVYRRLTSILCQRDPWEDTVQSLEGLVKEKGRLPLRRVGDERHLAYWLNTQQCRFGAGRLLEHRWRRLVNSSSPLIRQRVQAWPLNSQDGRFKRRCLELKAYIETNGELPRLSVKTPNSQSHRLALWLRGVANNAGWTRPDRREMLESLHPLVAELVWKWAAMAARRTTPRIDLPIWQRMLQRLVAWVQAKGHLPSTTCSDPRLYDWFRRNIRRLERLPEELVKQFHDSHPLIAAQVRAAQVKHAERAGLQGVQEKCLCPRMLWAHEVGLCCSTKQVIDPQSWANLSTQLRDKVGWPG